MLTKGPTHLCLHLQTNRSTGITLNFWRASNMTLKSASISLKMFSACTEAEVEASVRARRASTHKNRRKRSSPSERETCVVLWSSGWCGTCWELTLAILILAVGSKKQPLPEGANQKSQPVWTRLVTRRWSDIVYSQGRRRRRRRRRPCVQTMSDESENSTPAVLCQHAIHSVSSPAGSGKCGFSARAFQTPFDTSYQSILPCLTCIPKQWRTTFLFNYHLDPLTCYRRFRRNGCFTPLKHNHTPGSLGPVACPGAQAVSIFTNSCSWFWNW